MRNLMAGCGVIALCLVVAGFMLARRSKPVDSLSAIGGGLLKEEAKKAEKETKKPERQQQPQTGQADNKRGNGANCKGDPPRCNWWDAKAYCGGSLPSVDQLKAWYNSECAGGRKGSIYCDTWLWSGEETSADVARYVGFSGGNVNEVGKVGDYGNVRCR